MSRQYVNRPRQLRQLMHGLQQLETEIHYGLTPLPEALGNIGRHDHDPISRIFQTAARYLASHETSTDEAWTLAIKSCWKETALKIPEQEIVLHLGRNLGSSDSQEQVKHLHLVMSQLENELDCAIEEQQKYARMWKSLGVLSGALIVTLMY